MEIKEKKNIVVNTRINAPVELVWKLWTTPADIEKWNFASDDWKTTQAVNDLRVGGKFSCRMEAKDGSFGFDFGGIYIKVLLYQLIEYTLDDDRKVSIAFSVQKDETQIIETFEAENENSVEMQRTGWQAILDNFKKYAESIVR